MPTFQPMFSKNVHSRACPVVLPPQGPETQKGKNSLAISLVSLSLGRDNKFRSQLLLRLVCNAVKYIIIRETKIRRTTLRKLCDINYFHFDR